MDDNMNDLEPNKESFIFHVLKNNRGPTVSRSTEHKKKYE